MDTAVAAIPEIEITQRAARRIRAGHVWVYRSDVKKKHRAEAGDVVHVVVRHRSGGTNRLGTAFFNPKSLITLRFISRERVEPDPGFWRARIQRAADLRSRWAGEDTAVRLVFSEADEFPGLIVDRYDDVLVIQTLCAGTERLKDLFVELLKDLYSPRAIVERNDSGSRKMEGLELETGVLAGRLDGPVEIHEGGLRMLSDPLSGQKTGYYLDQRENRVRSGYYAQGRCLDVFSYQGGFGLHLKKGGAEEVTLVDQSARALETAEAAARLNRLEVRTLAANAFDFLKSQQTKKESYDVVVLDPPAFAKNRNAVPQAVRGYKEINLRAMRILNPGGILISSSCSYHMLPDHFEEVLGKAARDAGRTVQVLERRSQSRDHPERLGFPESRYLKCYILRVL
jgi:23S rRNA (cytosine1962-C5)-methyltransferase